MLLNSAAYTLYRNSLVLLLGTSCPTAKSALAQSVFGCRPKHGSDKSLRIMSNCIPKNMPADLKTLIRVSGDFFSLFGKGGGGGDF